MDVKSHSFKVAIIGDGKAGEKLKELLSPDRIVGPFNLENPPTVEKLSEADVGIVFVPGVALLELLPLFLKTPIPLAIGSTGFSWPEGMAAEVERLGHKWIYASNFSIGINLVKRLCEILKKADKVWASPRFFIHEIHHAHKKDAPSGTALNMNKWLDEKALITSERVGDEVGVHTLTIRTEHEILSLEHRALDRIIFAQGALYAAKVLVENKSLSNGIHEFSDVLRHP